MTAHADRPLYAIGLNLLASIIFCAGDTIAKKLAGELPIVQITWTRYIVFVVMALLLTARAGGPSLRVHALWRQVARGLCLVGSSLFFILGIRDVGLAEATTIGFIGPILVTFLSIPLLGERVDARRWIALAGGMAGVLIAGDAISSFARSVGQGMQEAGSSAANSAQNMMNQAKEEAAHTTASATRKTTPRTGTSTTKTTTGDAGGQE